MENVAKGNFAGLGRALAFMGIGFVAGVVYAQKEGNTHPGSAKADFQSAAAPSEGSAASARDSVLARWQFDSLGRPSGDLSQHGHELSASGFCSGVGLEVPEQGQLFIETEVYLDEYPAAYLHNRRAVIAGQYAGLKLAVSSTGQIQAAGQTGDGRSWLWYGPESRAEAVPLKRWVRLAVGADQKTGQMYAWVDGKPVPLWSAKPPLGPRIRPWTEGFAVGRDAVDGQEFSGKIRSVQVLSYFPWNAGEEPGIDPDVDRI